MAQKVAFFAPMIPPISTLSPWVQRPPVSQENITSVIDAMQSVYSTQAEARQSGRGGRGTEQHDSSHICVRERARARERARKRARERESERARARAREDKSRQTKARSPSPCRAAHSAAAGGCGAPATSRRPKTTAGSSRRCRRRSRPSPLHCSRSRSGRQRPSAKRSRPKSSRPRSPLHHSIHDNPANPEQNRHRLSEIARARARERLRTLI